MKAAILTDLSRCVGCKACVLACKEANGLPKDTGDVEVLSATTLTALEVHDGINVRRQCMHCEDPACASVCPVAALHKTPEGPVVYDADRCIGCRYCMVGCPFGVPKYEWSSNRPYVKKCIMCYDQAVKLGKQPACTSVCPTGATVFGDRDTLLAEAHRRIDANPERYVNQVYGEKEAGGTSVLYLSPVPFEKLGFKMHVQTDPYPRLTWAVLSKIPNIASVVGVGMFGVWWLMNRREEVAKAEGGTAQGATQGTEGHTTDPKDNGGKHHG